MVFSASDSLESMHASQQQVMVARMLQMNTSGGADMLSGGLMSRGMAAGKPLMSAGMGMMGLDPMSIGLSAGSFAWNRGAGLMGAGITGMGFMAGAGIVGAGASYIGGQMMTGAQQQLGLNQSLRQNFNFMNQQGGMGFSSNQGYQIGDALRGMSGVQGPGGELAGFGELSKLAANMGKMGMAQNVRTVTEFKENFKKMLDTVKTVAHDLGTSLEEAQKMMVSMKNSGIFNKGDQLKMSGGMRIGALAGGLAMSEMSAGANIGSQISRSIGGLGRQGAFAGMKTMEQIGIATKMGVLSEEDIYNATGQTGAEGRQALAAAQMQQSASFMQSGRGRRFLASIAGKDGSLNMSAVNEWMAGGDMSTGRTMELAHQNLNGVGRANFIRNEGRLRGAALEKFGGIAQSLVYKQWLSSRGYTPDDMDDRSMLAFQRFSGMGRDEADLAIKEVNALPEMMQEMKYAERNMNRSDMLTRRKNTTGIQGLKRKWDEAKLHVQEKFEKAGASILEAASDYAESWFNQVSGIYVSTATEGIEDVVKSLDNGVDFDKKMRQNFGIGGPAGRGGFMGSLGGAGGTKTIEQMQAAAGLQAQKMSAVLGTNDASIAKFGKGNLESIKMASTLGMGGSPEKMVASFKGELAKRAASDPEAQALLAKLNSADPNRQAAIVSDLQRAAGVKGAGSMSDALNGVKLDESLEGKFHSEREAQEAMGRLFLGKSQQGYSEADKVGRAGWGAKLAGGWAVAQAGAAAFFTGGLSYAGMRATGVGFGDVYNKAVGAATTVGDAYDRFRGIQNDDVNMGRALQDKENLGILSDLSSGESGARNTALDRIRQLRGMKEDKVAQAGAYALAFTMQATDEKNFDALDRFARTGEVTGALVEAGEEGEKLAGIEGRETQVQASGEAESGDEYTTVIRGGEAVQVKKVGAGRDLAKAAQAAARQAERQSQQLDNIKQMSAIRQHMKEANEQQRRNFVEVLLPVTLDQVRQLKDDSVKNGSMAVDGTLTAAGSKLRDSLSDEQKHIFDMGTKLASEKVRTGTDAELADYEASLYYGAGNKGKYKEFKEATKEGRAYMMQQDDILRIRKEMADNKWDIDAKSIPQKRDYLQKNPNGTDADAVGASIAREEQWTKRAKGKGGDMAAAAKTLGLNVDEKTLEQINKNWVTHDTAGNYIGDKTSGVAAEKLLAAGGLGVDEKTKKSLQDTLAKAATGGAGNKAALLSAWAGEHKKELQEGKSREDDPSYRALEAIRDSNQKSSQYLEAMVRSQPAMLKALESIEKNKNPEGNGKPGKTS